jgi:pyrroloquinoline quinone biosynthesis protein D
MTAPADNVKPRLADKARLKWDAVREKHLLLFPEGVLVLNKTAHDILVLCDGERDIAKIVESLAAQYAADATAIDSDVKEILLRLVAKGFVTLHE